MTSVVWGRGRIIKRRCGPLAISAACFAFLGLAAVFELDHAFPHEIEIRPVSPLGDDALEPIPTRRPEERLPVAALMLAVDDSRRRVLEQLR